ncbi:MAG: hypothetical protein C0501_03820 [Isosphaera sp.]|nr:hypothetical protein [Isosphaera sp.]
MSTEAALLRAIRDAPDDDTARLVYADYVEEEGDPARGEFVRVQVALARTPEGDPARAALEDREHDLLAEHERHWLGADLAADGLVEWEWERGFVREVAATPTFMLNEGAGLCAAHPVRRWRVTASQGEMGDDLRLAGQRPWFRRLEAVDLAGWFESVGELERFLTRSEFDRLRELDLTGVYGLADLPGVLERAPFRERLAVLRCGGGYDNPLDAVDLIGALAPARLTELSVPGCMLTAPDVRGLLAADCCRELTSLDVRDNPLEPDGGDAFVAARGRLRELDLSGTPLGAISLADVLSQESVSELRVLELNRCGSAMANIRALAASRFWGQAEELRLQNGTIPEHSLDPLFESAGPPGLRVLDVSENFFRDAGVRRLCESTWAGSLTWLGLSANYLTDEALRLIAGCGRFARLHTLHLSGNNRWQDGAEPHERITDAGVQALAGEATLAGLRTLVLNGTDITAAGVERLLNAPGLALTGLGLGECFLDTDIVRVLAASPRLARLTWLDLSGQEPALGLEGLKPLADSPYLSPLCELDIRGCGADDATRAALRERLGRRLSD